MNEVAREMTDCERVLHEKNRELQKMLADATYRADKAESENHMLRECIVKLSLERTGCVNG